MLTHVAKITDGTCRGRDFLFDDPLKSPSPSPAPEGRAQNFRLITIKVKSGSLWEPNCRSVSSTNTSLCARWSIILPVAIFNCYLVCYTTAGDVVVDFGLGTAVLTQIVVAIDFILISDVQRDVYPNGQPPGKEVEPSLKARFRRALSLYTTPRGLGWSFEPWSLPKPSSKPRFAFVISRIALAFGCTLLNIFTSMAVNSNPALSGKAGTSVRDGGWFYHTTGVFAFALGGFAGINAVHCIFAALYVGFGISGPQEWPNLFGSPFEAYKVQRFWGRTWHQMLRRPLKSCAIFIGTKVFHCPIDNPYSLFVFLNTAFFISGLVHIGGETMMLGRPGAGAFRFFILQGLAITLETMVSKLFSLPGSGLAAARKPSGPKKAAPLKAAPSLWTRIVGYVWVFSWFWWSLPFIVDSGIPAGAYGPHRGLTFEQLSELVTNAYHQLTVDV